ncbi:ribonucleoside-triphosphate reductase class III catalytic subunit [Granulicatella balaenopterae]|uniref:Ribonucleoside-triphosphate reductase class III catalytic subunit n=1 Tax=Granulicatella balaenopterae TaxID=137733 RepID=A0A1H9KL05_9LACT|nr:anaerobic ribonucleoside-triphosphate reductase [Granulicatella balaenopterae]SEQ99820.1 ribonucleoside-triphosphate reductase class III catalytic subunit [Granulicatella balaenopterae]
MTEIVVIKRDGRTVDFDKDKILQALLKGEQTLTDSISTDRIKQLTKIMEKVNQEIYSRFSKDIKIYEIQNIVEHMLIEEQEMELAEEYIQYRAKRDLERVRATDINYTIQKLLKKDNTVVNENANKDSEVFNTQRDLTAGTVAKAMGLKMIPEHVSNAHLKGDIHYHDLDYHPYSPMTNCCLIDFKGMFKNGFKIGNADVASPRSIQTATAQMAQIIANVASSQYGGCSANRVDEVLAPYAQINYEKHMKDAKEWIDGEEKQLAYAKKKTEKDIYDAMQSLEYEINTLYSSQGQTPFTTLGFGLGEGWFEKKIQEAILNVRIKGIGKEERTAIFPKLVFSLKKGLNLNPEDPNYDVKELALKCATKRMYPDILNYDKLVELTGSFKVPMGCRSFLQGWTDESGQEVNDGRMNLGVVTLNLPRIAMESGGNLEVFWKLLGERLDICKDALVFRVERVKEAKPANAPILYMHGAFGERLQREDSVDELFKNKRATVSLGYIGLYEVASVFYGGEWETNPEAKEFTLNIVKTLKENTDAWGNEFGYHFSVYSTPSESLTDRFCRLDTEKFGIVENITDKQYYTNSFHYDVRKNPTPFEKLDFEKDYPKYCSGGFIHYCEYPVIRQNPKALEAVWDYAYDKIGYLGTNTPIDHCYKCDYDGDFTPTAKGFECPSCGNTDAKTCDVVKRTCGYLGNPQARPMVHGRHKEISSRVKHMNLNDERTITKQSNN